MSEWLEGRLTRVLWHSDKSGYAVVRLQTPTGEVTAVGDLALVAAEVEPGTFLALEGHFEQHSVHGAQFKAEGFLQSTPQTLAGMTAYLTHAGIPGVGERTAASLVDHFGVQLPGILSTQPERLTQVNGIGKVKAQALHTQWCADAQNHTLIMRLRGLGLTGKQIQAIQQVFGDRAAQVVATEPYVLTYRIAGVGFKTADRLATEQGLDPADPARAVAAARYALDQASKAGHCYLPREVLTKQVAQLGVPTKRLDQALDDAEVAGLLAIERTHCTEDLTPVASPTDRFWHIPVLHHEQTVAEILTRRTTYLSATSDPRVSQAVLAAERYVQVTLEPKQREAVVLALSHPTTIITGGPGTGKTTLLRVLVRAATELDQHWLLASPTGRAARRIEEATEHPASTLHRLLEARPEAGGFQRGPANPLDADGLVVDEASMVDLELMRGILDALPDPREAPMSLVLVGDVDQLPSVGAGQILRDCIQAGRLPVVRLERVFRQGADSGILEAASAIHQGQVPTSAPPGGDVFLLHRPHPQKALATLLTAVCERLPNLGFDPLTDVQVLTPTRKGPLGTHELNQALQARLNPSGAPMRRAGRVFRVGDRVVCTRNRYDIEVFNGDIGQVIGTTSDGLQVAFEGREVVWEPAEWRSLALAYALTIHKSQGSEYPATVIVLDRSHGGLLRRNLFYTAVSRAKRFLCVIGDSEAWRRAVTRQGGMVRYTRLVERLTGQ